MTDRRVAAIVLAAGFSGRMEDFKPLLELAGITAMERCVALFRDAGVSDVRVVTGHRGDELAPLLHKLGVCIVDNPRYMEGMFSSVLAGMATIEREVEAFFILPVDIPLVRPATIRRLLQSFREGESDVLYSAFLGERGHPPLISARITGELAAWNGAEGLKGALHNRDYRSRDLEVADCHILLDMDTPEDLALLEKRAERLDIPTVEECTAFMERVLGVESRIVRHGRAVAQVAVWLGEELNRTGYSLDIGLIEAAALLHDIAKGESDHAHAGAELLGEHGFAALASAVAIHMDLGESRDREIGVAELLYLADKLVQGESRVTLEERFGAKLEKYEGEPAILASINRRLETARTIMERIESVLGRPLEETLAN